jgi:hypothetical protein
MGDEESGKGRGINFYLEHAKQVTTTLVAIFKKHGPHGNIHAFTVW